MKNEDFLYVANIEQTKNTFNLSIKSLKIANRKVNIILGENGAGKTTLLNYLFSNDNAFEGHKKVLLTQTSYTFNRTCEKNVEMVLKWNHSTKQPTDLLDMVGLLTKKNTIGNELSGGEKKRLALAMALATDADVLLLDEPFANIDSKNQKKILEILKGLVGEKTIIVVSHRMDLSKELGDYYIWLEDGKIVEQMTNVTYKEMYTEF